jgi:M6 family metalloprotease-like protein
MQTGASEILVHLSTLCAATCLLCADDFTTDFESGYLRGWTKTGTAFDFQPTRGDNPTARGRGQPAQNEGQWWVGTYEQYQGQTGQIAGDVQGDGPVGTLTSSPFLVLGDEIHFLIGGGNHPADDPWGATMVTLEIDGVVVRSATGNDTETMTPVAWPVEELKGKLAQLKIIDNNSSGWGHINCDSFVMVDAPGNRLPFTSSPTGIGQPRLTSLSMPSGPNWSTASTKFGTIGDRNNPPLREPRSWVSGGIVTADYARLKITFCGEVEALGAARVFVRALVDGQPASPSDVVFAVGPFKGTRSFNFIQENLSAGGHWVEIQWCVDPGGTAFIGDASLSLWSPSALDSPARLLVKAAPSGAPLSHTGNWWENLDQMNGTITTPAAGNLAITFSAEGYGDGGARLFIRALVDGQVAEPGDVLLAGNYYGVSSYTFARQNVEAGQHSIVLQWMTDEGQTAHIADRTLTVIAAPELTKHGGLTVRAPAPGADETTTSASWTDAPGLSASIATAAGSHLEIGFTAETTLYTAGKALYARALVDGQPADPSDVLFLPFDENAFSTRAFTFTKTNLIAGPHDVRIQWRVAEGGRASLGDRTMTLNYWRKIVPDLGAPFFDINPVSGTRKVLAILWDPHRPDHPAPAKSQIETLLFGPKPSVTGYFQENSGGRLRLENAGVLGWYDAAMPASYYWGPTDPGDANGDGWISPHVQKWAEAVRAADADFNFAAFDTDGDGILSVEELAILIVIPQNSAFGTMNYAVGRQVPLQDLVVDGVKISPIAEVYIGSPPSLGVAAHELAHLVCNAGDMYFGFFQPYAAGPYSIMDQSPGNPGHLDPFHKLKLGWLTTRLVRSNGWYEIRNIESSQEALLLCNPDSTYDEYFLVENRWRDDSYDAYLPCSGLAVWHIIENASVFLNLPTPPSVDPVQWNDLKWKGWARRGIRMIRPIYGPPWNTALWDGSNASTGYDLLSTDANPSHVSLRWANGTPSGFSLLCQPDPGPSVTVGIKINDGVLQGPPLAIVHSGINVELRWPVGLKCFQLQMADNLAPQPSWSWAPYSPQVDGDFNRVVLPAGEIRKFYRLVKP